MGNEFSNHLYSKDRNWASVSAWHKIEDIQENAWDTLNEKIFQGLNDDDMEKITGIMTAKKSCYDNRNYWIIDHEIIRITSIKWDSDSRQYSWEGISKPQGEYIWRNISRNGDCMKRLAINVKALDDFKAMKKGISDGTLFKKTVSELVQYRKNPDNK